MKLFKRCLAFCLSVSLMVSAVAVPSFAEEIRSLSEKEEIVEEAEIFDISEVTCVEEVTENSTPETESAEAGLLMAADQGKKKDPVHVSFDPKSWQSNYTDQAQLYLMSIPESHDSGTYNIKFTKSRALYLFMVDAMVKALEKYLGSILGSLVSTLLRPFMAVLRPLIETIGDKIINYVQKVSGQCQSLTIKEQLDTGVRALDLRFRYDKGAFNVYHGDSTKGFGGIVQVCECYDENDQRLTLEKCFKDVAEFIQENPTEFVLLNVQNEGGIYDKEVEEALYQLEKKYGIDAVYSKREYSVEVVDHNEGSQALRRAAFPSRVYYESDLKGRIYDITDASYDNTDRSWDETVDNKIKLVKKAIRNPKHVYTFNEIQCNVAVKLWLAHDPNEECEFPIQIKWTTPPFPISLVIDKVPCGLTFDMYRIIKSPHDQAIIVNGAYSKELTDYMENPGIVYALGLVGMDFVNPKLCCLTASANSLWEIAPVFDFTGNEPEMDEWDRQTIEYDFEELMIKELIKYMSETDDEEDDDDVTPAFTGTPENPVTNGTWLKAPDGAWSYKTSGTFRNTWAYIYNPYAADEASRNGWFYFDKYGNLLTGWQLINGKWYYLNPVSNGTLGMCFMGPGKTPDGHEIDATGARIGE